MNEQPVLLDSAGGVISAVLTTPDIDPVATVVVVQGWGGTRAGANQVWSVLARDLAREGLATLRADYAGTGESWDARIPERAKAVRELTAWYRRSHPATPLLFVAHCFGLSPAVAVCRKQEGVIGVALVVPPIFPRRAMPAASSRRPWRRQVRGRLGVLRRLPVRAAYRLRYGPSAVRVGMAGIQDDESGPTERLVELVRLVPTWMLTGEHDTCREPTERLLPELSAVGDVELETVDGLVLRSAPTAMAQAAIRDRVTAWARRRVAEHAASASP